MLDTNECASNPCQHASATCNDGINGYTCDCPSDWVGIHCEYGN